MPHHQETEGTQRSYRASVLPLPVPSHPADWWHRMHNIRTGINSPPSMGCYQSIPFHPENRVVPVGVSMELARMRAGLQNPHQQLYGLVKTFWPVLGLRSPVLSIRWPGYQCLDKYGLRPLELKRPLTFHPTMPLVELAKQVADIFFEFATNEHYARTARLPPTHPDLLLLGTGPGAVNFNRLRMVRIWSNDDGRTWGVEVAVVDDYVQQF